MRVPRAIFFDFDGVILESLDVKTNAMARLFKNRPEHVPEIIRYHLEHSGVPRRDKFRYFYAELFREPLDDFEMARVDEEFRTLIWEDMKSVPFVRGSKEFLAEWYSRIQLFVISAAPQAEVSAIVRERGLESFFYSVYGNPPEKGMQLKRLLLHHNFESSDCLFVGDASADSKAARANHVPFVQRLTTHQPVPMRPEPAAVIKDLAELAALWDRTEVELNVGRRI